MTVCLFYADIPTDISLRKLNFRNRNKIIKSENERDSVTKFVEAVVITSDQIVNLWIYCGYNVVFSPNVGIKLISHARVRI